MKWILLLAAFFSAFSLGTEGVSADEKLSSVSGTVSFEQFGYPYFVKNTLSPPAGLRTLILVFDQYEKFDEVFGVGWVMGTDPHTIKADYFKDYRVVSFIEWGNVPWKYTIRRITKEGNRLIVKVSKTGVPSETAQFTPCVILGIPRAELNGTEKILFDFIPEDAPVTEAGEVISAEL